MKRMHLMATSVALAVMGFCGIEQEQDDTLQGGGASGQDDTMSGSQGLEAGDTQGANTVESGGEGTPQASPSEGAVDQGEDRETAEAPAPQPESGEDNSALGGGAAE